MSDREKENMQKENRPGDNRERGGSQGGDRGGSRPQRQRGFFKRKVCKFCTQNLQVDYKSADSMRRFVTERGKILPRRITGTCARHQRHLARVIKRARVIAVLPFVRQ